MATSLSEFNFIECLQSFDPGVSYSIHAVTGGVVNITVRATKDGPDIHKGRFAGHASMIMKHAPPYIAKLGKDAPFSESRQTVEAQALKLLGAPPPIGLSDIALESTVSIPELLHHDSKRHVLVIADLGAHLDLTEIFSDLGGSHPTLEPVPPSHIHFGGETLSAESVAYFQDVGTRLGAFFARLHAPSTKDRITNRVDFQNLEGRRIILDQSVKPAIQRVVEFLGLEQQAKAASLEKTVMEDALRETAEEELSFTLGDCWPSAILVSDPAPQEKPLVGVIDWEFANFGPGIHGDMAQLMAHLEMLRISAKQHRKFSSHLEALNELIVALIDSYRSHSRDQQMNNAFQVRRMRSAFISCGLEMIDCAQWKKWVCADPECTQNHEARTNTPDCSIVTKITRKGIRLLELACEDIETFQSSENRERIEAVNVSEYKDEEKWLLDLF